MSAIIDFYEGNKPDKCRHFLTDIWTYSFKRLEDGHDYIQWMFPLNEPSAHNLDAPILTDEDITRFQTSPSLKWRLMTSVHVFMMFLHFTVENWINEYDHNHLRITRVLKCLILMGLVNQAEALLEEINIIVNAARKASGDDSFMRKPQQFWFEAVYGEIEKDDQ